MAEQSFVSTASSGSNKTLWYVLAAIVGLAIVLGGAIWFYANQAMVEPTPSTKPLARSPLPQETPKLSPSPVPVDINVVSESKSVTFPKAGRVFAYYLFFNSDSKTSSYVFDLVTTKANASVQSPTGLPKSPAKMHIIDTGLDVVAGEAVAIQPYDFGNFDKPSQGWLKPAGTACGSPNHLRPEPEIFTWMRSTIAATGEPIVSEQCWSDWDPDGDVDYNDFLLVFTYGKPTAVASPTPKPSVKASATPTPTPTPTPTKSPTPTPTPTPTPKASTTTTVTTPTPTPTPRTATVDTSSGVPVTGVIEDTIMGLGLGFGLVILGLIML